MNWELWRRWTVAVTLGELAGFTVPALAAVTMTRADAPSWLLYSAMLPAGAVEGACLGFAQVLVLRRYLPQVSGVAFTTATAVGASVAYALGMLPSTVGERMDDVPAVLLVLLVGAGAPVLLLSIGVAQALVLRRSGLDPWWWIVATAGAWMVALAVFLTVATPLWQPGQPLAIAAGIGIVAGGLMAATAAALTGFAAAHLVREAGHTGESLLVS